MAKLFALKKIAHPTCDCPSHLCAHGALCAIHYAAILHTVIERAPGAIRHLPQGHAAGTPRVKGWLAMNRFTQKPSLDPGGCTGREHRAARAARAGPRDASACNAPGSSCGSSDWRRPVV
jgi:hypothetical protein